jgi:hypothetical protein
MRFIRIIHEYVIPVPDTAPQDADWDTLSNAGVSIMEDYLTRVNPNIRDLRSSWETMPVEYEPIQDTPQRGSVHRGRMPSDGELMRMQTEGVNFVSDIMGGVGGVQHPHDQGLSFFPPDHPLHEAEQKTKRIADAEIVENEDPPKEIEP